MLQLKKVLPSIVWKTRDIHGENDVQDVESTSKQGTLSGERSWEQHTDQVFFNDSHLHLYVPRDLKSMLMVS